jgi:trehalose 6-phosphate synthase/phosphatase
LRDGINLVAKEFVACRAEDDGVLVLSEFAGAAPEMSEALVVNPYDVDALAKELYHAIKMPEEEQRFRMGALRARVAANDVGVWTRSFMGALESVEAHEGTTNGASLESLATKLRASPEVIMLLDYDGTLVPFAAAPDLAVPDVQLLELLRSLGQKSGWDIHVVSGRKRETLERWLGGLPVALHAEHGYWSRARPTPENPAPRWEPMGEVDVGWKADLRSLLERFRASTPGAIVEEKTASLAWHYRLVEPDLASQRTDELRRALEPTLRNTPLEILEGDKVLEVRLQGVTKAVVAHAVRPDGGAPVLAMGDDATDADMFRALPPDAATIGVGPRAAVARYRVDDPAAARRFLDELVQN